MATIRGFLALAHHVSKANQSLIAPATRLCWSRSISSAVKLSARNERRPTRDEGIARPKKQSQYTQSSKPNRTSDARRKPSRPRRRQRAVPPRNVTLPDLGFTSEQLGALAGTSEDRIFKCAKELDDSVFDMKSLLSPPLVELVTEELSLNVILTKQTKPLFPDDEWEEVMRRSSERRMPVVTCMGHVDHGKTSLLDALRNSDVAKKEVGGITQSVAAFRVPISIGSSGRPQDEPSFATFIDTPGHAAFKAMRTNGTVGTDLVILVVAADDGVMPQTVEAAELARSADVPIVVAINKCDVSGADPEKVRFQLLERLGINTEQLGGDVQCVDISAKTGSNLPSLLEAIILQAELVDLRTNSEAAGYGVCLESRIDKALGSIATVVIRMGTMRKGDHIVFQSPRALHGHLYGRIRNLISSDSTILEEGGPGNAVGVVGVKETIPPGAEVRVVQSEREARAISQEMISQNAASVASIQLANSLHDEILAKREAERLEKEVTHDDTSSSDQDDGENDEADAGSHVKPRGLVILVKGDVKGSADAVAHCIQALGSAELPVRIIGTEVGDVNERDIQLAAATNKVKGNKDLSMIIAFNVRTKDTVAKRARKAGLAILEHSLIYHLEDDIKGRMVKLLAEQQTREDLLGQAAVVRIFEDGTIAGCSVDDGIISEGDTARVMRFPEGHTSERVRQEIYRAPVASIKQFAKIVRSVKKGSECGVSLQGWSDFLPGDHIESIKLTNPNN